MPTGFTDLDELTNGLHGGQMVIVAARPSVGKSTLALDFARSAAVKNNLTAAFFSLEMSQSEIVMRLLAQVFGAAQPHPRRARWTEDDWQRIIRAVDLISGRRCSSTTRPT